MKQWRALTAIDVEASFKPAGIGFNEKTIVDSSGRKRLNSELWEIGEKVFNALQNDLHPDFQTNYANGHDIAEMFVLEVVDDFMVELHAAGRVNHPGIVDFPSFWKEQSIEYKILKFIEAMEGAAGNVALIPGFEVLKQVMASMILLRLDDAVISEFLDGRDLIENLRDIDLLWRNFNPPSYVAAIEKTALRKRAKTGSSVTSAKYEAERAFVYEWLDKNFKHGAKHSDLALQLEKLVPREYDTILKDITAWKKRKG
ncbi:hypothetical protein SDC9_122270 [bioreactor metagenome]|uniref:Uncharacterized protein n=1 Tax=bioreactor metagenome TaxID=1076179 RepID=A0A645CEE7_9ZZZZ